MCVCVIYIYIYLRHPITISGKCPLVKKNIYAACIQLETI